MRKLNAKSAGDLRYYGSSDGLLLNVIDETGGDNLTGSAGAPDTEPSAPNDEHFRSALAAAGIGEWAWDIASGQVDLSPKAADIFGVSGQERIDGVLMREILFPEDLERALELSENSVRTGAPYEAIFRVRGPKGDRSTRIVSRGKVLFDQNGVPMLMYGIVAPLPEAPPISAVISGEASDAARYAIWALEQTLDAMGSAVLMVDRWANVIGMSDKARQYIGVSSMLDMKGARIFCRDADLDSRLQAAIALIVQPGSTHRKRIDVQAERAEILVFPLPDVHRRAAELGIAALVVVNRRELPSERIEQMAAGFGLTRAERAVLDLVLDGMDPTAIAELRKTSRETIRAQLKAIHAKTGVSSRANLMKLFLDAREPGDGGK